MRGKGWISGALLALSMTGLLLACQREAPVAPPPRGGDPIPLNRVPSLITVPVQIELTNLVKAIETEVPQKLWSIDRPDSTCAPSQKIDIGIAAVKTPKIKCRIVGAVTRGTMKLQADGQDILISMPLHAVVHARDIAGILKQETATADAVAHARVRLRLTPDWKANGTIDIDYKWTSAPHLDFLGQRIDLTEQADAKLRPVVARLERQLPGELEKLKVRQQVEQGWRAAFTTLELNERNPPVWMRVAPLELQYGGYDIRRGALHLRVGLKALTDTKVGTRPADPAPTPLPNWTPLKGDAGQLQFFLPVVADYAQLEPVLMKALRKRSARPFDIPGVGPVMAKFHKVQIYGTHAGKLAVGIDFTVHDPQNTASDSRGMVWLVARPTNAADSRKVGFTDLQVQGTADVTGSSLLFRLANAPALSETLAMALGQNFQNDYDKLLEKIARAIDTKREGKLIIHAQVTSARTGQIKAAGAGLYLPVLARGQASITFAP